MATEWNVPSDFPSINAALLSPMVLDYDTIRVSPGTYTNATEGGPIIINKMIQLLGAQAGVDARTRQTTPAAESVIEIVDGTGSIQINRDDVVVDGFTVQNNTNGVGIFTTSLFSGYWIFNNIIQDNAGGLFFDSNTTAMDTTFSQAKNNFFRMNNQAGGGAGGNGIYTQNGTMNLYIDSNKFSGHFPAASINFAAGSLGSSLMTQKNIVISNNEMENDNSIALTNTTNVKITGNQMTNTQGSAIFIAGGTNFTEIEKNTIHNSTGSGISVNTIFLETANTNIRAKDNSIQGNSGAGLQVDLNAYIVALRRLDATNNGWGSPTGPTNPTNPGGTGDAVVDANIPSVVEFIPFLTAEPIGPTCDQLLSACQVSSAALQSQLNASQAALAATQAELAACQASLAAIQLNGLQKQQAACRTRTDKIKARTIRWLKAIRKEVQEVKHFLQIKRLRKARKEMNDTLLLIRKAKRTVKSLKC